VNRRRLFAAACAGLFFFGAIVALLGTLFGLPGMRERLGVDLAQQGELFSMLFVGIIIATAVAGPMVDRFGYQATLTSASLLAAVGLTGLSLSGSFRAAALSIAILGLGGGGLNTATNAVVSELYPGDRGRMLNLLGMFFGAGALFVPLVKVAVFGALSISGLIGVIVALGAACTFTYGVARFPPAREAAGFPLSELLKAVTYPGVIVFALLLLVETGNESTLSGWVTTYIGYMGWPARVATGILAGYWAAVIAGRALFARLSQSVEKKWIVVGCGIATTGGCALLMGSQSIGWLTAAALATSLAMSGVFQTTLAMVGDRYHRYVGTVFGVIFAISGLGGMITPAILGHVSQAYGVRTGMVVPLVGAAIVTALAATIRRKA
jgi:FHS family glucose/mannose:H+ symporter-like MFS transporter